MPPKKTFKFQKTDRNTSEHCCVPLCRASSKYNSVISFHTFPTDTQTRQKWIVATRRDKFPLGPRTRVCSLHFKKEDLREPGSEKGRRLIKKGAVPALFEWNKRGEVDEVPGDHDYASTPDPAIVDLAIDENVSLREENLQLRKQIERFAKFSLHAMSHITQLTSLVNEELSAAGDDVLCCFESQEPHGESVNVYVKERMETAARHISALLEIVIKQDQHDINRYRLLDIALKPSIKLHRTDAKPNVVYKVECQDQEEPEPPCIKEEEQELWTSQEREQELWTSQGQELLAGLEENCITLTLIPVLENREDDEEENQSSELGPKPTEGKREPEPLASTSVGQLIKTKAGEEDCGLSEEASNLSGGLEPCTHAFIRKHVPVSNKGLSSREPIICINCKKVFSPKNNLNDPRRSSTGEKPFSCRICKKGFNRKFDAYRHMTSHTGEKPFSCPFCKKSFRRKSTVHKHIVFHTGQNPTVYKKLKQRPINICPHMFPNGPNIF